MTNSSHLKFNEFIYPLGNLVADVMLAHATESDNAVAALINAGSMNNSIGEGEVTYSKLLMTLPFGNTLVVLDVTGQELVEALDNGFNRPDGEATSAFLSVAGLQVTYCDTACPDALLEGGVVTQVLIAGEAVDLEQTYRIATHDVLVAGGDNFTRLETACERGDYCEKTDILLVDLLAEEFQTQSPVTRAVAGRINKIGLFNYSPSACTVPPCTVTLGSDSYTVVPVPSSYEGGIVYGNALFNGSEGRRRVLPSSAYAVARLSIGGSTVTETSIEASLSNKAEFEGEPILAFESTAGSTISGTDTPQCGNEKDQQICRWSLSHSELVEGDEFYLLYQIKNAEVLAEVDEKIELSLKLLDNSTEEPSVLSQGTVTIASAAKPWLVTINPGKGVQDIKIAASTGATEFVSTVENNPEFRGPNEVVMGYLSINNNPTAHADDAYTDWDLGNTDTENGGSDAFKVESVTLTITKGPFAASLSGEGKIYLDTQPPLEPTELDATGTAKWKLTNEEELRSLIKASQGDSNGVPIVVKADGTTEINNFTDPPQATLVIDLGGGNTDPYSRKLPHIRRDGTSCTLYNVPAPDAADEGNIRIINDSSTSSVLIGTLRDESGEIIFSGVNLLGGDNEIQPYKTERLTSETLAALEGGPYHWEDRAVLTINAPSLLSMEVFGLVRPKAGGPLTNMSVGGSGNGCD